MSEDHLQYQLHYSIGQVVSEGKSTGCGNSLCESRAGKEQLSAEPMELAQYFLSAHSTGNLQCVNLHCPWATSQVKLESGGVECRFRHI